jgi:ribosomal-protein-serine acetyltransferase
MESRQLCVDDQILMKEIDEGEVVNIFNAIDAERDYLSEWLPFVEKTVDIEFTRGFVNSYLYSDKKNVTFAIYFEHRFAGLIGLKDTDEMNMKTEIGYWLSSGFQHKGVVTKCSKALITYLFDELKMNRIQLKAGVGNIKSRAVAERLGFELEGIERDGELHSLGYIDLAVYSLLKKDF